MEWNSAGVEFITVKLEQSKNVSKTKKETLTNISSYAVIYGKWLHVNWIGHQSCSNANICCNVSTATRGTIERINVGME